MARNAHDAYMTPEPLVASIVARVKHYAPNAERILEPSCGTGEFLAALHRAYPEAQVIGVDIRPEVAEALKARGFGAASFFPGDFLEVPWKVIEQADLILTNPPFNLYRQFVEHALNGMKSSATLVLLSRFGHLVGSRESQAWWLTTLHNGLSPNRQIVDTLPIFPRPSFTANGGTDSQEYALVVFRKGFDNGGRFEPIVWDKPARERKAKPVEAAPATEFSPW